MQEKRSGVGEYSGYSEKNYDSYMMRRIYIPLTDGTRLAASLLFPAKNGVQESKKLPVIMHFTPYAFVKVKIENGQKTLIFSDNLKAMQLIPYGYILAEVEVRGCGISFGTRRVVNSRREAADGAEALEWLATQDFCNGKVGTVGWSYHGQTQLEILSQKPKHLLASVIGMTDFNRYDGWVRNGVPRAFGSQPDVLWSSDPDELNAQIEAMAEQELPTDADPAGIEVRKALREHVANGLQIPVQRDMLWRDSSQECYGGKIWHDLSASTYQKEIEASGAQIYLLGGIYDVFRRETVMLYRNLKNAKKLTFGPWYHVGEKKNPEPWIEMLRWFDFWLKGIENGVADEKPINLCVGHYDFKAMNHQTPAAGTWRSESEWRPGTGSRTVFYLSAAQNANLAAAKADSLSAKPAEQSELDYRAIYDISTSVESTFAADENGKGAWQKGLLFATEPLQQDASFIGHGMATLSFRLLEPGCMKKAPDLDFFVTVADYDPETQKAFQFDDGHLRASLRAETPNCPYDCGTLPWHENLVGSNQYLKVGERYTLKIDLMPTAYTVKKGHLLCVMVENSQSRMYYAGRAEFEADPGCVPPRYALLLGGKEGSRIELENLYE